MSKAAPFDRISPGSAAIRFTARSVLPARGIQHLDLAVADVERSLSFYRALLEPLGLTEYSRVLSYRGTEEIIYLQFGRSLLGLRPADGGSYRHYDELGPGELSVQVNVGLHWGATLTVGQVATSGRLEVTALGDPMNEAARIEAAASSGSILASKELIERLEPDDASGTGIDPDGVDYVPLGELEGASEKAIRDAGTIPVAEI